jgi:hypothetical protein
MFLCVYLQKIEEIGGSGLLKIHHNSLYAILTSFYPDHNWVDYQLGTRHPPELLDENFRKLRVEFVAKRLNVKEPNDWYSVPTKVGQIQ